MRSLSIFTEVKIHAALSHSYPVTFNKSFIMKKITVKQKPLSLQRSIVASLNQSVSTQKLQDTTSSKVFDTTSSKVQDTLWTV